MNLATNLARLDEPIRVGFVGAGIFGSQVIHATEQTAGMETAAIAELDVDKAIETFRRVGAPEDEVDIVDDVTGVDAVVDSGGRAVATDATAVVESDVDVVVEATGDPNAAARNAFDALMAGTNFVNVSVESDTVCGGFLTDLAERNGATYTLAYGDQPGQIVDLCEWAGAAGFEVVAAGKSSRKPQHYGAPDDAVSRYGTITSFGGGIDPDPFMYNSFMDGTKAAVETVATANALGLALDTVGTHKPEVSLAETPEVFRPEDEGGLLSDIGVVDAVTPTDVDFSVFVVTRTDSEQLRRYYAHRPKIPTADDGRYQVFYRPFHFASETTVSIARAALYGEHTGAHRSHEAEVVAAAKTDLAPGDELDGGGGYTVYGVAANAEWAAERDCVPFELLDGAEVVEPIERDEFVTDDHVSLVPDQPLHTLRELQTGW